MRSIGLILIMMIAMTPGVVGQDKGEKKDYGVVDPAELAVNPVQYDGKLVEVMGEVVSIKADHSYMEVFDARTKVLIRVSLAKLTEGQRRVLINGPVHRVAVFGKMEVSGGRIGIVADSVLPQAATLIAG